MTSLFKFKKHNLFLLVILINFFLPTFHIFLGSRGAILLQLAVMTAMLLVLMTNHYDKGANKPVEFRLGLLLAIYLYYFLHICISTFFSEVVITSDIFELHKPLFFLLCLLFFTILMDKVDSTRLFRFFSLVFILIILFGVVQYLGLGRFFSQLYTKMPNIKMRRVSIPFTNPYDYAFNIVFINIYYFNRFTLNKLKLSLVVLFLISLGLLLLTQSKTGIIYYAACFSLNIFLLFVMHKKMNYKLSKLVLFVGILIACATIFIIYYFDLIALLFTYLVNGLKAIFSGQSNISLEIRLYQLTFAIEKSTENLFRFLFGNGVSKAQMKNLETIYTFYIFRYGFGGLFMFFILPWMIFSYRGIKMLRQIQHYAQAHKPFLVTAAVWLLLVPFASLGNAFSEQVRDSFFYLFIGVLLLKSEQLATSGPESSSLIPLADPGTTFTPDIQA